MSLARALISDASFWTIDEPLSGLDPKLADTVIKTLRDHAKQKDYVCLHFASGRICSEILSKDSRNQRRESGI